MCNSEQYFQDCVPRNLGVVLELSVISFLLYLQRQVLRQHCQTGTGAYPASCPGGTIFVLGVKAV